MTSPKIQALLTYLEEELGPVEQVPDDPVDRQRRTQSFRVTLGTREQMVVVSNDFFDDRQPDEIGQTLKQREVAEALQLASGREVLIATNEPMLRYL